MHLTNPLDKGKLPARDRPAEITPEMVKAAYDAIASYDFFLSPTREIFEIQIKQVLAAVFSKSDLASQSCETD